MTTTFARLVPTATPAGDYLHFPADLSAAERDTLDDLLRYDGWGPEPWGFTARHHDRQPSAARCGCCEIADGFDAATLARLADRGYLTVRAGHPAAPIYVLGCWVDVWPTDPTTGARLYYRPYAQTD